MCGYKNDGKFSSGHVFSTKNLTKSYGNTEVKAVYMKNASDFANNTDRVNKTRENLLIIKFTTYSYTDLSHLNSKGFTQISPIKLQTSRVQKSQILQNVFDLKFILPGKK